MHAHRGQQLVVVYNYIDENGIRVTKSKIYFINNKLMAKFSRGGFKFFTMKAEEFSTGGSDKEIKNLKSVELEDVYFQKPGDYKLVNGKLIREYQFQNGAHFPYLSKVKSIDLTPLQIARTIKEYKLINNCQCFVYALI